MDPATAAKPTKAATDIGTWRLARLESAGFGGLNLVDGPNFVLALNGENWCLEGQNGSGKTSIASAIWALTGCRCRDRAGVIVDDGRRISVFNDSGVQIGDWPPLTAPYATHALRVTQRCRGSIYGVGEVAIADVEDIPAQPCGWNCRRGFVHRAHDRLQVALLSGHLAHGRRKLVRQHTLRPSGLPGR